MAWYKIDIYHGPGHQGHATWHKFFDKKHTQRERNQLVEWEVDDKWCWDDYIVCMKRVQRLPKKVRADKIKEQKSIIKHARLELKFLQKQ